MLLKKQKFVNTRRNRQKIEVAGGRVGELSQKTIMFCYKGLILFGYFISLNKTFSFVNCNHKLKFYKFVESYMIIRNSMEILCTLYSVSPNGNIVPRYNTTTQPVY